MAFKLPNHFTCKLWFSLPPHFAKSGGSYGGGLSVSGIMGGRKDIAGDL